MSSQTVCTGGMITHTSNSITLHMAWKCVSCYVWGRFSLNWLLSDSGSSICIAVCIYCIVECTYNDILLSMYSACVYLMWSHLVLFCDCAFCCSQIMMLSFRDRLRTPQGEYIRTETTNRNKINYRNSWQGISSSITWVYVMMHSTRCDSLLTAPTLEDAVRHIYISYIPILLSVHGCIPNMHLFNIIFLSW